MNYNLDTEEGMAHAVRWTETLFNTMNNHASWGIPRSGTLVTIDKDTKTATIRAGFASEQGLLQVIRAMGWTVKVE